MLRKTRALTALGALSASTALVLGTLQGAASADPQAQSGDVVGVGSDTVQYASDFLMDGDTAGDLGFNFLQANRVFSDFATGDGNGRALYDSSGQILSYYNNGSTTAFTQNGTTSLVLRAGQRPVTRPDGSGAGVAALIVDTTGQPPLPAVQNYEGLPNNSINFARMSRLPNSTEITNCDALAKCNGLRVYQFATDSLQVAVWSGSQTPTAGDPSGTTNIPALSIQQLGAIYAANTGSCKTLAFLGVTGATSTNPIIAALPQSGSGTRNFFLADLQAALGSSYAFGTCPVNSEEHDPTGITHAKSPTASLNTVSYASYPGATNVFDPADAIEPFSAARVTLINGQPASATFPAGVAPYFANSGEEPKDFLVKLNSGTPSDSNPIYNSTRGLYFATRQYDFLNAGPMEPGGTKNFVKALFDGSGSLIGSAGNAALVQAAGMTWSYKFCGVDPTTC
jgi:hypothetical protein